MINITFKPGLHDGELKDNPKSFPAGLVYLALQAEASDEEYSGFVSGWVRPEVAKLVKAAPELLEALKEMGDWLAYGLSKPDGAEPTDGDLERCERIAAKARAAIAKATA
jgi:hypothetical protein